MYGYDGKRELLGTLILIKFITMEWWNIFLFLR